MSTNPSPRQITREEQLAAQARLNAHFAATPNTQGITKATMAEVGQGLWPHTYRTTSSDEVARDNWLDFIDSFRISDPERHFVMSEEAMLSDWIIVTLGAARWFDEGMPVYRPGHKQAASLMATSVSAEMAEHVKAPHRAFYIELPDGLIEITDAEGKPHPATGVFVHVVTVTSDERQAEVLPPGEYWRWICLTRANLMLWEMNRRVEEMIAGTVLPEDEYYGIGWEMNDHDMRVRRLIKSLIISLCLDSSSGKTLTRKSEPVARVGKKAAKGGPCYSVFLDPSTVDVDARPFVRAFLAGDRRSPDFQQLVKGHWKSQPYGPGLSLRKPIQIAPYKRLEHLPERPVGATP